MQALILCLAIGSPCDCSTTGKCDCEVCTCPAGADIPTFAKARTLIKAAGYDADAEAALALAKAKLKPKPKVPAIPGSIGDGHTHTCANGHTWNHATHAGHDCPVCGLPQYIQDTTPRAVNLTSTSRTFQLTTGGGCANGQCNLPQTQRRGLFGFRN